MLRPFLHWGFKRQDWEADLDEQLRDHIERRTEHLVSTGMTRSEAERAARLEFGSREAHKEACRQAAGFQWLDEMRQDIVYALRILRRSPGFTTVALLSLALGIGANTVVFSVLNALLLRPLPIANPGRVYAVNHSGGPGESLPNYRDIRDRNSVFESLFAYRIAPLSVDAGGVAHRIWGYLVTGNYFESLGIQPAIGRFFGPAEDRVANASPYAVLSYSCWMNRFAGDPQIPGRVVRINGHPYTVLGVAPQGFHGTEVFYWSEIWLPMTMQPQIEGWSWLEERTTFNSWVAGRFKPGVTVDQAESNLEVLAGQLAREHRVNEGMRLTLSPPGMAGALGRGPARTFAGGVMLLALLVLVAACANLANLQASRAADRFRDLSIRLSIGAARSRIIRQLITESLVISCLGGASGCALALVLLGMLNRFRMPLDFPVQFDVSPDWRVFLFAVAAAVITGVLFGIAPARQAWKLDAAAGLKSNTAPAHHRRWAARDLLLTAQIAVCCILVTASVVAVRGLMRSFEMPLGFQPDGAAVLGYSLGLAGYSQQQGAAFEHRLREAAGQLPGVESAAYASSVPLSIDQSNTTVYPEGTTDFRPVNAHEAGYYQVSPGYFAAMGTRLVAGRDFSPADNDTSPPVAIVNRTFAVRLTGSPNAVGRRFVRGNRSIEIVGIVEDGKYTTLTERPKAALFLPIDQDYASTLVLIARARRSESEVAAELRQLLARQDPHLPAYGVGSLRQMLGFVYLPMHAAAIALGAFGILALMLSVTGIYGVAAYTVSRRVREIGIRMAIGARPGQVLRFVFGRTGILVAIGAAGGLTIGIAAAPVLSGVVYQASSQDPAVVGAVVAAMVGVAAVSVLAPAGRAIGIDPVRALRQD